ncbi:hypothetical protein BH23GEM3_BH23GEM3_26140 [soil metagenome]
MEQMKRRNSGHHRCLAVSLLVLVLGGIGACGDGAGDTSSAAARSAPDGASSWRVDADPVVVMGNADNERGDPLFRVLGAVRLRDGRIVVANSGSISFRSTTYRGSISSAAASGAARRVLSNT